MTKWIEAKGKNEEAAIAAALSQLGLERDDVSVEVLERAKSGFLGIGSTPARVRVSYEAPDEETPVKAPAVAKKVEAVKETVKAPVAAVSPAPAKIVEKEASGEEEMPEMSESIHAFLTGLFEQMHVTATPNIVKEGPGIYQVTLEGEKLGSLIGHRGETLDAIQQLTNYAVNRSRAKRVRIHIDAENYRAKREESLQRLAQKVAGKVVKYRRNITLEPMNAYERHVIHEALQEYKDVLTYSTGTEPHRRTVVAYNRGKQTY